MVTSDFDYDNYRCSHCGSMAAPIDSEHCPECQEYYDDIKESKRRDDE